MLESPDEDIDLAVLPIDLSTRGKGGGTTPDETLSFIRSRQSPRDDDEDEDEDDGDDELAAQAAPLGPADEAPPYHATGPIEQLLEQLRHITADQRVARRALGEEWVRFAATPDLEIHVRGEMPPEQLLLFEQITDHIRHILLGGDRHV